MATFFHLACLTVKIFEEEIQVLVVKYKVGSYL